jgi:hypothetical protein
LALGVLKVEKKWLKRKKMRKVLLVGGKQLRRGKRSLLEGRKQRMREKRLYRLWYEILSACKKMARLGNC